MCLGLVGMDDVGGLEEGVIKKLGLEEMERCLRNKRTKLLNYFLNVYPKYNFW